MCNSVQFRPVSIATTGVETDSGNLFNRNNKARKAGSSSFSRDGRGAHKVICASATTARTSKKFGLPALPTLAHRRSVQLVSRSFRPLSTNISTIHIVHHTFIHTRIYIYIHTYTYTICYMERFILHGSSFCFPHLANNSLLSLSFSIYLSNFIFLTLSNSLYSSSVLPLCFFLSLSL